MAKIFVTFLGTGSPGKKPVGYDSATYNWPEKSASTITAFFAQTAILKILQENAATEGPVDKMIVFCTKESKDKHLLLLQDELGKHLETPPQLIVPEPLVPTDMTSANQWGWFEQLVENVDPNDTLIIDFTHGMRAVPIVFSSAIGFLQRAKGVTLLHALYAWYDPANKDKVHPIVEMRDFYVITDWVEAVARLTDDADARKLGELAGQTNIEALQSLADDALIRAFEEMTDCIRNVDVNNVGRKVESALAQVERARATASGSARVMLDLVWQKFHTLEAPGSGRYDLAYFQTQLEIIRVLLEHRLFMQAFTAMRELVGSIGMAGVGGKYGKKKMSCADGRKYRGRFAEVFVNMMQHAQEKWNFQGQNATDKEALMPWFTTLQQAGIEQQLRDIVNPMVDIRNGFDHAWTAKAEAQQDVADKGAHYYQALKTLIDQLTEHQLLQ